MSGRKFHIDKTTGEISALWSQDVLVERFALVSSDLSFLFKDAYEQSLSYPVEMRGVFLAGALYVAEGMKLIFEERFDELNKVPTGQLQEKIKSFEDEDDNKGEI